MSMIKFGVIFAMYAQAQTSGPIDLPEPELPPTSQQGVASWYGNGDWHGSMTANGETFDPYDYTCAHRSLPFDTVVLIENGATGKRVWCRINDRGPYGYMTEGGEWAMTVSSSEAYNWRGILDMSTSVSRALGTQDVGLQQVYLRYYPSSSQSIFDLAAWSP